MPTSFTVFSLGKQADIDTTEGNSLAENASALVGLSFGGPGNALLNNAQTFSPGATGFAGGTSTAYDQDNSPNETFKINGGPDQTFDSSVIYNATITYIDGTTATVTAVVFQDTAQNTYWAPEFAANSDQAAMEAKPIQSIKLDSVSGASFSGMSGSRESWNHVTCYLRGTRILTSQGERAIEEIAPDDFVHTRDNGLQRVLWVGQTSVLAMGKLAPVRLARGSLGPNIPQRDMYVSRQHRIMLRSKIAGRMSGSDEVFVPAIKLTQLDGIDEASAPVMVTYFHLLTERHEVIYVEGALSETLLPGPQARAAFSPEALEELETLFPGYTTKEFSPARPVFRGHQVENLIGRHKKNGVSLAY
jgi:hypothetical protein